MSHTPPPSVDRVDLVDRVDHVDHEGRAQLLNILRDPNTHKIVVITGAGISVPSGIPPFRRSEDAIWEKEVTQRGTYEHFRSHPADSWRWYHTRFSKARDAKPNPAHYALTDLAAWAQREGRQLTLITQNVDGLHIAAGSPTIEIHGSARLARCASRSHTCPNAEPRGTLPMSDLDLRALEAGGGDESVPRCAACGDLIRPHLLWFDERYDAHEGYRFEEALRSLEGADLFLFVGTSFAVGITANALYHAEDLGAAVWAVDPSPMRDDPELRQVEWLAEPSEVALPAIVGALGSQPSPPAQTTARGAAGA